MSDAAFAPAPNVSVVIATYRRGQSVARLLQLLALQTIDPSSYEVIVVDDGSDPPVAPLLEGMALPYRLVVMRQANGGPAVARHAGVVRARGPVIVMVDDDMRVGPQFLAHHLAMHPAGSRRLVLGLVRPPGGSGLRLFERMQLGRLDQLAQRARAGIAPRGMDVYTGNLSLRRDDYIGVGGFDQSLRLSEDAELGYRLERAGVEIALCEGALSEHESDHASLAAWFRRSEEYGAAEARIAAKHGMARDVNPWRYLFLVHPISRPWLFASAMAPSACRALAWVAMALSMTLGALRLERGARAGATFTYGLLYFAGVRRYGGSRREALRTLARYLHGSDGPELGAFARTAKMVVDVRADHAALRRADEKYGPSRRRSSLAGDLVNRVGFQMLAWYRLMRLLRDVRLLLVAKVVSRMIRHAYGADLHWDAELAPGVIVVHGNGLVVSHAARVGAGCILFQHVTLGESVDAETRQVGAPLLEGDVHVGPGATLLGPITIGRGTKIAAGSVVMRSVPGGSVVEMAPPSVRSRTDLTQTAAEGPLAPPPRRSHGARA
jgi:serine acetyltransferase/GT2 family glycosyltransferase